MGARVCVLLAPGFEEIEAITVVDVLRRAELRVTLVGVGAREVAGAQGIRVMADMPITDAAAIPWDMVVLPGGMPGSTTLRDDERVQALITRQAERGGHLAAICAAPIALAKAGVLRGKRATSYPSFREELGPVVYLRDAVVSDDKITTSRGPGTALPFALQLVATLRGDAVARNLAEGLLFELASPQLQQAANQ